MADIYLASPFFTNYERRIMKTVLKVLRNSGYTVYAPYEFKIKDAWEIPNHEWGNQIYRKDMHELKSADCIVAINYGYNSDAGTAFEIGVATALGLPVFTINFEGIVDSLMINNSALGMISFEYFKSHDTIELNDFIHKKIYNEQK